MKYSLKICLLALLFASCSEKEETSNNLIEPYPFFVDSLHPPDRLIYGFKEDKIWKQLLINPEGIVHHVVTYENDSIISDEGEYFFTGRKRISSENDSLTKIEFNHTLAIPDTNMLINLCVFEYDYDSLKYLMKEQLYIGSNRFNHIYESNQKEPIMYFSMYYVNKDNSEYHYEVHDPFKVYVNSDQLAVPADVIFRDSSNQSFDVVNDYILK